MEFHKNLKRLRLQKELSQIDLANKLNISQSTYNRYELGHREPDIHTIIKIANFFNVSIDYLLGNLQSNNNLQIYKSKLHEEIHKKIDKISSDDLLLVKRILDTCNIEEEKYNIKKSS